MSSIGINVGLQSLFSALGLASAALVLARERMWKWMDAVDIVAAGDLQQIRNLNTTILDQQSQWLGAWVELGMAWYLGFAAVWALSIVPLALTFRWPIPLLALPNISILVLGLFVNAVAFGAILAWLLGLPSAFLTRGYEQKVLIFVAFLFLLIFALCFAFIALSISHYHLLQRFHRSNTQIGAIEGSTSSSSPTGHRSEDKRKQQVLDVWNAARMSASKKA